MNDPTVHSLLALVLGYLLGSIPFGLVLSKAAGLGDVRKIGSGNIGATNVLRTGNKPIALATLLLDGGKGALAYLIALKLAPDVAPLAGAAAFLGHLYPVYLGFKGGKGVATFGGLLCALAWPVGLLWGGTWLLVLALFRMSSLAGLMSAALSPFYAWIFADSPTVILTGALAIAIFIKHEANIRRILAGTEPRIGKKGKSDTSES
ncbi:glycerol-3-phosphate acyltransferase [Iodidimonas muriae]|uniref:Glycerol-3-phosphate acyltransferase n=1 Tax=Iodidimonas muriae TaxID=261467 RepID=A0ABQ2LH26_9PROT|nr:glycerol-3-phosphate 1-O-acyltransferase PlsY [Iodidimonas muriae]GER07665.1 glycerol-3-phosphate acyltransferase [Kordiimonadales bacterium JCM 17843]GGO14574.1 glycerol-3-phosphate acyltransferase [Iodidimonas muriae]